MISFKILKKSRTSRARVGFLETPHGEIETPCLVPVATQAVVKTLTSEEALQAKSKVLISNTFHLHLKPGEEIIKKSGGLHKFMNWKNPLMTDSGGFQVFSLGFGKDFKVGKIYNEAWRGDKDRIITENTQSREIKITEDGVYFRSPVDGGKIFLGPKESVKIQEKLGADIIFAFDECTPPMADLDYIKLSLKRTHNWAKICLKIKKSQQAIFGIAQGSRFKNLRQESAGFINSLEFDGFGIGGDLGHNKKTTKNILDWTVPLLNEKKPRHLLGIGHLEDMELIIKAGIDLFDCTVPTHYARRGVAFTSKGRLDIRQSKFLKKKEPLDKECVCLVCQNYKINYISHLLKAGEITALKLLTFHNLFYFNTFVEDIKEKVKKGEI